MRISLALIIYVSLAVGAFADGPAPDWGTIHKAGSAAEDRRNYAEAAEDFRQSWLSARTAIERGVSANDLGQAYRQLGRTNEAKEWLERAYALWHENLVPASYLVITASSLGDVYRDAGNYKLAETFLREALESSKGNPDSADPIRNSLGDLLREEGRPEEARNLFSASLQRAGLTWQQRVNALTGLADIDRAMGDWDAGAKKWNEVLEIARSHEDRRSEAIALRGLGSLWTSAGELARAEPLLRRSLSITQDDPAAPPQEVATARGDLARLYLDENKLALAEEQWLEALKIYQTELGDQHPQVALTKEMLAALYAQRGETDSARNYANQALETMKCLFGENSMPAAVAYANHATVQERAHDLNAAAEDYARAFAIMRGLGSNSPAERVLLERYARLLKVMHHDRESREISTLARSFRN